MKHDDQSYDDRMRALFHDAVADVQPRDRLAEVRRRTRARRTSGARSWTPILIGAGAVAATVVAASLVFGGLGDDSGPDHDTPVAGSSTTSAPTTSAAGLYFLSDTPTGPRLFREFQAVSPTTDPEQKVLYALERLTYDLGPRDPDYRTLWPSDSFSAVRIEDDRIVVELGTDAALQPQGEELGLLGVQQAVYTAEAALGDTLPVTFELDGQTTRWVLGARVPAVVDRDRSYVVTAPVNITDPSERLAVEGDSFSANGTVATNAESRVRWALLPESGGAAVVGGVAVPLDITGADARATLGSPGWEVEEIDVSELAAGDYVLVVTVSVAGQTSDRPTEFSDTRTITVR